MGRRSIRCLPSRQRDRRRGSALLFSLIVVTAVGSLAAVFLQVTSARNRRQAASAEIKEAFYLAEAGLAEAYAGIAIGHTGNVGTPDEPAVFGDGLFWVAATDQVDGQVQLDSTAMVGTAEVLLSLVVQRGVVDPAALGVFSDDPMVILPGTRIDAYDSSRGTYDESRGRAARVSSNGDITIAGTERLPTLVKADLVSGPQFQVLTEGAVTIEGTTESAYVSVGMPEATPPVIAQGTGQTQPGGVAPLIVPPGEHGYRFLSVLPNAQVIVQGPATLSLGELYVGSGAELELDTSGGAIEVYVDDHLELAVDSTVSMPQASPDLVLLQVTGPTQDPVQLLASSQFHGVFHAPEAQVEVASSFEVFGALVGKQLTFLGPAQLHFDQQLVTAAEEAALPSLVSWRIVELSSNLLAGLDTDPFTLLGLDPAFLPRPADAHEDQLLSISYLDGGGGFATYDGLESAFDWTDVTYAISTERDGAAVAHGSAAMGLSTQEAGTVLIDPTSRTVAQLLTDDLGSSDLRDGFLAHSPLPSAEIDDVIMRNPPLSSSHLMEVLLANTLTEPNMTNAIKFSTLTSRDLYQLMLQKPQTDATLTESIKSGPLESPDLRDVLIANSPLSPAVMTEVLTRIPPLDPQDLLDVQAVQ